MKSALSISIINLTKNNQFVGPVRIANIPQKAKNNFRIILFSYDPLSKIKSGSMIKKTDPRAFSFSAIVNSQIWNLRFTRVKLLVPCLRAPFQDEARCHEVTSLSLTMEVVIATSNNENFFAFALSTFCSTVQRYIASIFRAYQTLHGKITWHVVRQKHFRRWRDSEKLHFGCQRSFCR